MSPAAPTVTRFAQVAPTPWRNGAGTTRELLREPAEDDPGSFAWRISIAEVTDDGPFSKFTGVDRVLMLCEGLGLVVVVDDQAHVLRRFDTVTFPGEAPVTARLLQGPTVDLNVMTTRETTRAAVSVQTVDGHANVRGDAEGTTVLVLLEGRLTLCQADADPSPRPLEPFDAVGLTDQATARLVGDGRIARIDLTGCLMRDGLRACM